MTIETVHGAEKKYHHFWEGVPGAVRIHHVTEIHAARSFYRIFDLKLGSVEGRISMNKYEYSSFTPDSSYPIKRTDREGKETEIRGQKCLAPVDFTTRQSAWNAKFPWQKNCEERFQIHATVKLCVFWGCKTELNKYLYPADDKCR